MFGFISIEDVVKDQISLKIHLFSLWITLSNEKDKIKQARKFPGSRRIITILLISHSMYYYYYFLFSKR